MAAPGGVAGTWHDEEAPEPDNAHVPTRSMVTVPVGVVAPDVEVSVTVTEQVELWPTTTDVHVAVTAVGFFPRVIVASPWLAA